MAGKKDHARKGKALVIGRFQPFHDGHFKAIKAIFKENGRLIIAIGSAQKSREISNPYTYAERREMIRRCLMNAGLLKRTQIVPLEDEHDHAKWVEKVGSIAGDATTLYSGNLLVRRLLKDRIMLRRMSSDVKISGTAIRRMMARHDNRWKEYVPREIRKYLVEKHLIDLSLSNKR
ncbi:MAG: nicotinamide-nucleotide adenylyltransferase [Candidatus Micrarchaeota archaeon]